MKKLIFFLLVLFFCPNSKGEKVPPNFFFHKDTLINIMKTTWNDITIPSVIPGLIEQETCYTLTHKRCWSAYATLKTNREYGFGLGQITVTKRFNTFEEVKKLDERLKNWKWEDRFIAEYQMIALVAKLKFNYSFFKDVKIELDRFSFALAAYNGGLGGIITDQKLCRNTKGCNPNLWYDNVENTSLKKRVAIDGYKKSFFQINREYPKKILFERRFKYKPYIDHHFTKAIL